MPEESEPATEVDQPNFVFVMVDDLDETTTPYWEALPQTKELVADRGLVFDNAFVVDPVCCPAKATFLTGRYSHNTGVYDNSPPDGGMRAFVDGGAQDDTIATRLQEIGYSTSFFGKYLNGYRGTSVPPGWDEWFALTNFPWLGYDYGVNHNGEVTQYGNEREDYQTDVLAGAATAFIADSEANDDQPFFAVVSTVAPHTFIPPAPRHEPNPFADAELPVTPNVMESDVSDKPTWLREGFPATSDALVAGTTEDHRRRMGSLLAVDDLVSELVTTLEANGELDDTVIVFASDNGFNLLSHRLSDKLVPYEESIRVPFVMAGPSIRTGTEDAIITNLDLAPTLLDLAGAGPSDDLDGRSLAPLLRGDDPPWRSDFLIEFNGTYRPDRMLHTYENVVSRIAEHGSIQWIPTYRALRTERWLYVQWYAGDVHEYELYDLAADPYQLENLLATPEGAAAHGDTTSALQERLEELEACAGETCRT